jgi:hypothetical protein
MSIAALLAKAQTMALEAKAAEAKKKAEAAAAAAAAAAEKDPDPPPPEVTPSGEDIGITPINYGSAMMTDEQKAALHAREQQRISMLADANAQELRLQQTGFEWKRETEQAWQRAEETEKGAWLGYSGTQTQNYLQNLQAAAGIKDLDQQVKTESGNIRAAQALTGTKQNTRYLNVVESQMAEKMQFAQDSLKRQTDASMSQATGNLNLGLTSASNLRKSYHEGGTMFNLYQNRINAMDRTFKDKFASDTDRYNYLSGMVDSTSLNFKKEDGSFNANALWNLGGIVGKGLTFGISVAKAVMGFM